MEFLPGPYKQQCWNSNSVYVDAFHDDYKSLNKLFYDYLPGFDSYSFMEYQKDEWLSFQKALDICQHDIPETFCLDFSDWLKNTLVSYDSVTFLGL